MRGPRGARKISGQIMDSFNGWTVDADGGECPMSTIDRKRFVPKDAGFAASCGYILVLQNPIRTEQV